MHLTFIASHVALHVIQPKLSLLLLLLGQPWRTTKFTLSSSLGKSVPPLSPSKLPMKSEQDILFPMFWGSQGERNIMITFGTEVFAGWSRSHSPGTNIPSLQRGEGPARSLEGCLQVWGSCWLCRDFRSFKQPPFSKLCAPCSQRSWFWSLIPTFFSCSVFFSVLIPPLHLQLSKSPAKPRSLLHQPLL